MPRALDVLFPLPLDALTYLEPLSGAQIALGQRVVVPWHGGAKVGVVVGERDVDPGRGLELRHAIGALDAGPWLRPWAVTALGVVARASGVPSGLVLATLTPPGFAPELDHLARLRDEAAGLLAEPDVAGSLAGAPAIGEWVPAESVPAATLELLRRQGLVDERVAERPRLRRVLVPVRGPDAALAGARSGNQRAALELLLELGSADSAAALARDAGVGESAVRTLVTKGYAEYAEVPVEPPAILLEDGAAPRLPSVPDSVVPPEGGGAVTGGTRLERLAAVVPLLRADLAAGRSAVVIAPEVAQAAEAAGALARELPVQYLTGGFEEESRRRAWAELPEVGPAVVVGTFTALLAPVVELGRVVLLDASSGSYKLLSGARTQVARIAKQLALAADVPLTRTDVVVTPETLQSLEEGSLRSLPLPDLRLHVADMRESSNWPLHPDLLLTLRQVAERGRQAVVMAPRRGFSGAYGCRACGWSAPCPNCDLTLRYHQRDHRLRCHQCGHDEGLPEVCPACGSAELEPLKGAGTEWIAGQLARSLEGVSVLRYDSDQRDDVSALVEGEPGVIVGTTAALRLPRLPNLSLLAVASFESHLFQADYRAEEEALRTLLSLAELAPKRRTLLLVQSFVPDHEVLTALGAEAREAAVEVLVGRQLERRKRFGYPPFTTLAKVQLAAKDRAAASEAAAKAADALLLAGALEGEVLGPEAAPVERLRGRYSFQLLLRAEDETRMERLLAALPRRYAGATLRIDVDPRELGELLD